MIWFWGKYGSKENADTYLTNFLNEDTLNIHKLLNSVIPIGYPIDGSLPHKDDFAREQYNYLQSFVNLDMVYEQLKKTYGDQLESEDYPYTDSKSFDLTVAKQFAWIHKKVLAEKQKPDDKQSPETIKS